MQFSESELDNSMKNIHIISGERVIPKNKDFPHNKYLYIDKFDSYSNLYHYILTKQKLYSLQCLMETENVSFTYIIFEYLINDEKQYLFYARPVYSHLETFAKHQTIYILTIYLLFGLKKTQQYIKIIHNTDISVCQHPMLNVIFAGEIFKHSDNKISYNFISGTFMRDKFKFTHSELYSKTFQNILRTMGFNGEFIFTYDTKNSILTICDYNGEIENIWSKHPSVEYYFLDNRDDCKLLWNSEKNLYYYLTNINQKIRALSLIDKSLMKINIDKYDELFTKPFMKKYDVMRNVNKFKQVKQFLDNYQYSMKLMYELRNK